MTYLYAVLGILMMSGIISIFNMSLNITSQPIKAVLPENNYQNNKFDLKDKLFLELLQNSDKSWGTGEELCEKIKTEINNPSNNFSDLVNYQKSILSPSENERIIGSCSFDNSNHRILIKPRNEDNKSFYYFSCMINLEKGFCDFEDDLK